MIGRGLRGETLQCLNRLDLLTGHPAASGRHTMTQLLSCSTTGCGQRPSLRGERLARLGLSVPNHSDSHTPCLHDDKVQRIRTASGSSVRWNAHAERRERASDAMP